MLKNLRQKAKNKKGFTLVELIVVIVIILILAAVLVPSLLRYVEKANQANCKADAATILSQLQADYAAGQAPDVTGEAAVDATTYTVNGIAVKLDASATAMPASGEAIYMVTKGEITRFVYDNKKYTAIWNASGSGTGDTAVAAGWTVAKK